MKHLSLFSGIGGFDLGFERAGIQSVGMVEYDAPARSVLDRHWPDVPKWEDVRDVRGTDLPDFDVLTGGFPCQDVSAAGNRAGLAGGRSGLWFECARIIAECRPTWVVIENVPGLLSSNGGRDMGTILGFLADHGYGFAYRVLDAQWFGVAQRRRRVFIVGHLGGNGGCQVLALGQGSAGDIAPSREAGQVVANSLETRPTADHLRAEPGHLIPTTVGALRARDAKGPPINTAEPPLLAFTSNAGNRLVDELHEDQSPPLRVPPNGPPAVASSARVRRLTPTECARLQGFPDDWNDHLSDTQRYRQYGNAVCVNVAEWIGRRLLEATL